MRKILTVACGLSLVLASLVPVAFAVLAPDQQAPDFTLTDTDGNSVTLSNIYPQHRVLLDFFNTH